MTEAAKVLQDGGVFTMRINHPTYLQSARAGHSDLAAPRFFGPAKSAFLIVGLAVLAVAAPAQADESIGGATTVVNLVTGDLSTGDKINVFQGDEVFKDEGVRTDADSSARLVLRDNTNLLLGPSSSIKLDRFVYSGPSQPGAIAVNLVKGALRFATGDADKKAYVISTPTAALGVRGTVLKIVAATPTKTFVQLDEGGALVCTRAELKKRRCLQLTEPGQTVEVTTTAIKWNAGAAASVSAVIDAIPDAPPGSPSGPTGQHADLTPPIVTPTVVTPNPAAAAPGLRRRTAASGDGGKADARPVGFSAFNSGFSSGHVHGHQPQRRAEWRANTRRIGT